MNDLINPSILKVYDNCSYVISNFKIELESKEYGACQFKLNGINIICRNAKITPKKVGQFVTFWKRIVSIEIEPFNENDLFDFFVVNVQCEKSIGQFVFPKSVLVEKGIISTEMKEGKRAFRVYPSWNLNLNEQALKSQKWQLKYFYNINDTINLKLVNQLYSLK